MCPLSTFRSRSRRTRKKLTLEESAVPVYLCCCSQSDVVNTRPYSKNAQLSIVHSIFCHCFAFIGVITPQSSYEALSRHDRKESGKKQRKKRGLGGMVMNSSSFALDDAVHISGVEHGLLDDLVRGNVDLFICIRVEVRLLLHRVDLPVALLDVSEQGAFG